MRRLNLKLTLSTLQLLFVSASLSAQETKVLLAQSSNRGNFQNQIQSGQIIKSSIEQKSLGERLLKNTSLSYYQQFLGPTLSGNSNETYNVFQEGIDSPGSGRAPLQSFHAVNLRHQINTDWALGATLSAVNGYTDEVENRDRNGFTFANNGNSSFFNARAYVSLPTLELAFGKINSTLSYEHPTSVISKQDQMRWGWVISESLSFNLPDPQWSAGVMAQAYRMYYKSNTKGSIQLQTMIVSGGPFLSYRFNDNWMLGSNVTFDWDQRGRQTGKAQFNNNLSDRGRLTLNYYPQKIKYLQSIGLFTQALLKYRHETTALGLDFAVRF